MCRMCGGWMNASRRVFNGGSAPRPHPHPHPRPTREMFGADTEACRCCRDKAQRRPPAAEDSRLPAQPRGRPRPLLAGKARPRGSRDSTPAPPPPWRFRF